MTSLSSFPLTTIMQTSIKSKSCSSKTTGRPLTEYCSEYDARVAADYVRSKGGTSLEPYFCINCEGWHLSPSERITPSKKCSYCVGSNGQHKQLYSTYESAENRARILEDEQGVSLRIYSCEFQAGYHLTKSVRW